MPKKLSATPNTSPSDSPTPESLEGSGSLRCFWSRMEDDNLRTLVRKYGIKRWVMIGEEMKKLKESSDKNGKQCRERWHNHLNPEIKRSPWTKSEETRFISAHRKFGNKWSEISHQLPGRTDNSIKNFFYCKMRKMVRKITKGIISDEQREDYEQLRHCVYLIWHLKQFYLGQVMDVNINIPTRKSNPSWKGDKYIMDLVTEAGLDLPRLDYYCKNLMVTVTLDIRKQLAHEFNGLHLLSTTLYNQEDGTQERRESVDTALSHRENELNTMNPISIKDSSQIREPSVETYDLSSPENQESRSLWKMLKEENRKACTRISLPFPQNMVNPLFRAERSEQYIGNIIPTGYQFLIMNNPKIAKVDWKEEKVLNRILLLNEAKERFGRESNLGRGLGRFQSYTTTTPHVISH